MKVWDNQLFLTQIMKHTQILISAKNEQHRKKTSQVRLTSGSTSTNWMPLSLFRKVVCQEHSARGAPQERYLHNKSINTGLNTIISLSKDATLRSNVLLYEDHAEYNHATSSYYGGLTPLTLETSEWLKQRTLRLIPTLKYEENSQKRFLSDELSYSPWTAVGFQPDDNKRNKHYGTDPHSTVICEKLSVLFLPNRKKSVADSFTYQIFRPQRRAGNSV